MQDKQALLLINNHQFMAMVSGFPLPPTFKKLPFVVLVGYQRRISTTVWKGY